MADARLPLSRAEALRAAFDATFAHAHAVAAGGDVPVLTLRAGGVTYAAPLAEIGGLHVDRRITALPGPSPELRGVAAVRGTLLPVYDLAMLLGSPRAVAPRWMITIRDSAVGLAFDAFDGHLLVSAGALVSTRDARDGYVRGLVRTADAEWPLLSLPSILESMTRRPGSAAPKER